jgi:hypothetical protein
MSATEKPEKKPARLPETTEGHPWVSSQEIKKETNPFTEKDWRMIVYAWSGLAVRIVLVAGAIFSVYQFLLAREETRIQRALEMVQLWEQPEYQAAQRAVKKRVDALNTRYATLLGDQPTSNDRSFLMKKIGLEAMTPEGGSQSAEEFQEEFDRVVYFLNRIAFCVEGNLCSRDVIDAYFRDYAKSFWDYFSGYADRQRDTVSPTYAQPIEAYVLSDFKPKAAE